MRAPRRVLVLTLSFGSGHVRAAHAVAQALTRLEPDDDVRLVDALADCAPAFRASYVWPYWAMVRYAPALWESLFATRLRRQSKRTAPAWLFRAGCPKVFATIARFDPDVIVSTEVAACEMAAIARRSDLTSAPIVAVITDRHAEPAWVQPEVDAYAVAEREVGAQLRAWGAADDRIVECGIPIDPASARPHDPEATRVRYGLAGDRPIVLLMGGGMGPTRMERIAARLTALDVPMHLVAVTAHDARARRRLARVRGTATVSVTVLGWTDDVAALMQAAAVLVTKPGGLTTAESAACGLPAVMFDAIPGPEQHNAARLVEAGAGILTRATDETVEAIVSLLRDDHRRRAMSACARTLARPAAAGIIARLALATARRETPRPVVILTIRNGAGHTRAADAIGCAMREVDPSVPVVVADVADYMTRTLRFTHVTAFLWLVRHAPTFWDRIDRHQKQQPHTSPEWYYRRGCRRLFEFVGRLRPRALVATEVGCCEIAALIKRDARLDCPLVAVNGEYDADRAWVAPEIDLYTAATADVVEALCAHGAPRDCVRNWGVPVMPGFHGHSARADNRVAERRRLGLVSDRPLVLIAGGSEGLGQVEAVAERLLRLRQSGLQVVVLTGRNRRLRARCERLASGADAGRVRVIGWTPRVPELMSAADLIVSKLGRTFDEAIASALPIVALEPPPGSERVQHRLLEEWGVGKAVTRLDEMAETVARLLGNPAQLEAMRVRCRARPASDAARRIAQWIVDASGDSLTAQRRRDERLASVSA